MSDVCYMQKQGRVTMTTHIAVNSKEASNYIYIVNSLFIYIYIFNFIRRF